MSQAKASTPQAAKAKASADTAAAAAARQNRWDLGNWNPGKVSLFQALGIKKGTIDWPQLQPNFTQGASQIENMQKNQQQNAKSGSGGSVSPQGGNPTTANTAANKTLGQQLAASYGWSTGNQWTALNNIVMAESGWNNTAQNPTSTAYGIGQFLDTTWASVGGTKTSSPTAQINDMLKYIKQRYGNPVNAWSFHLANGWY